MKIFTHTLVIYDNGWCWKWKEKQKNDGFVIDGSFLLYVAIIIYLIS